MFSFVLDILLPLFYIRLILKQVLIIDAEALAARKDMDHACSVDTDLGSHVFGAIVLVRRADQYLVAVSICIGEYGVTSKLNMAIEVSVAQLSDADLLAELGRETFVEAFEGRINRIVSSRRDSTCMPNGMASASLMH